MLNLENFLAFFFEVFSSGILAEILIDFQSSFKIVIFSNKIFFEVEKLLILFIELIIESVFEFTKLL